MEEKGGVATQPHITDAANACAGEVRAILTAAERRRIALGNFYGSLQLTPEDLQSVKRDIQQAKSYETAQLLRVTRRVELDAQRRWHLEQQRTAVGQNNAFAAYRSSLRSAAAIFLDKALAAIQEEEQAHRDFDHQRLQHSMRTRPPAVERRVGAKALKSSARWNGPSPPPILTLDVELSGGASETLAVYEGEDPEETVARFALAHKLPAKVHQTLLQHVLLSLAGDDADS